MTTHQLRPWSQVVRLDHDVESGNTAVAAYAIDLGALVAGDPRIPRIYRQPRDFFAATYLTSGMRRLLSDVLDGLAGGSGDRVLAAPLPVRRRQVAHAGRAVPRRAGSGRTRAPSRKAPPCPIRVRCASQCSTARSSTCWAARWTVSRSRRCGARWPRSWAATTSWPITTPAASRPAAT